eukprot:RCo011950
MLASPILGGSLFFGTLRASSPSKAALDALEAKKEKRQKHMADGLAQKASERGVRDFRQRHPELGQAFTTEEALGFFRERLEELLLQGRPLTEMALRGVQRQFLMKLKESQTSGALPALGTPPESLSAVASLTAVPPRLLGSEPSSPAATACRPRPGVTLPVLCTCLPSNPTGERPPNLGLQALLGERQAARVIRVRKQEQQRAILDAQRAEILQREKMQQEQAARDREEAAQALARALLEDQRKQQHRREVEVAAYAAADRHREALRGRKLAALKEQKVEEEQVLARALRDSATSAVEAQLRGLQRKQQVLECLAFNQELAQERRDALSKARAESAAAEEDPDKGLLGPLMTASLRRARPRRGVVHPPLEGPPVLPSDSLEYFQHMQRDIQQWHEQQRRAAARQAEARRALSEALTTQIALKQTRAAQELEEQRAYMHYLQHQLDVANAKEESLKKKRQHAEESWRKEVETQAQSRRGAQLASP